MSNETEGMPFASSIGFSITTRCPVACSHCIVEAGPHRREEMSIDDARNWIAQAAVYRNGYIKSAVFTGGEPFFNRALLAGLLDCAISHGLVPAVVTNAFWATSRDRARETLAGLPQIKLLSISTDVYHQRAIPLKHVRNAIGAAQELGVRHNLAVCFEDDADPEFLQLKAGLEQIVDDRLIRLASVFPAGRARKTLKLDRQIFLNEPAPGPCLGADFPTVFPDGRVVGCMALLTELPSAHPLYLGSLKIETLARILDDAETNVALHLMRVWGPSRLVSMLREAGYEHSLPRKYIKHGHCDLCYALLGDSGLMTALARLVEDRQLAEETAYARQFYLKEEEMVHLLQESAPGGSGR